MKKFIKMMAFVWTIISIMSIITLIAGMVHQDVEVMTGSIIGIVLAIPTTVALWYIDEE